MWRVAMVPQLISGVNEGEWLIREGLVSVSISDNKIAVELINGQEVFIPDVSAWKRLVQTRVFNGKTIFGDSLLDQVQGYLDLVHTYPEFSLGFRALPAFHHDWLICMVLKTQTGLQRVHIEWVKCDGCGWYGAIANPMLPDLYVATPNKAAAFDAASKHAVLPCPKCGSKLPRHAIWTEPLQS